MTLLATLIVLGVLIGNKNKRALKMIENLKSKLMWSSILRSILQGYFISIYQQMEFWNRAILRASDKHVKYQAQIQIYFTLVLAVAFPIFTTVWLLKNKKKLVDEKFAMSYGSLY